MKASLLQSGLGFPEGPVVMGDGRLVLCDGNTGELLSYADGRIERFARTGGSPWGAVLGIDGAVYVTQGGNVPGSGDASAVSGIQRVSAGGTVELLFSEVAGYPLYGPNDLVRLALPVTGGGRGPVARPPAFWTSCGQRRSLER